MGGTPAVRFGSGLGMGGGCYPTVVMGVMGRGRSLEFPMLTLVPRCVGYSMDPLPRKQIGCLAPLLVVLGRSTERAGGGVSSIFSSYRQTRFTNEQVLPRVGPFSWH